MQAGSRKAHGKATLDSMCLAVEVHPQAEDSGGYDLDAAPVAEELDFLISEDVPSGVVAALLCLGGGMLALSQSRPFYSVAAVRGAGSRRSVAHYPLSSGMFVSHHVSRSGGGLVSWPRRWTGLLEVQFVQSLLFAMVC